jgi:SAM-dependent methyltransferase
VECSNCGFVYAGLLPDPEFLEAVYEKVIDPEKGLFESLKPEWVAHQLRLAALFLEDISDVFPRESGLAILDYGCGYGTLVKALSSARIRCVGFETSQRCKDHLRGSGMTVFSDLDELQANGPFHGVVLSDVLEHVINPGEVLRTCQKLLVRSGLLCVSVPNFSRKVLRDTLASVKGGRSFTRGLNPWEHLNYFSADSLEKLVRSAGFVLRRPVGPVDVGLRYGFHGWPRVRNAIASSIRLIRYVVDLPPETTTLVAQKGEDR